MSSLDPRRLGGILDRLLRSNQATHNAQQAASEATRNLRERKHIEREVDQFLDRKLHNM